MSQPSRSISNGFIRTSAAGKGQLALCWSIALEIASRFFASGEATVEFRIRAVQAVCGGGGSDTTAWAVVLGAILLWAFVAALAIRAGRDSGERLLLASLLVLSGLIGPLSSSGSPTDSPARATTTAGSILALVIPGAIGAAIALTTRTVPGLKAFFVSTWGALFATGGIYLLFIAFLAIGSGCID